MDCIVTFDGQEYSYEDFANALNDGLLEDLVSDGSLPTELAFIEGKKRGFTKSAQASDIVAEQDNAQDIINALEIDPEGRYTPQQIAAATDKVEKMSEQELLLAVGKAGNLIQDSENNVGVLAGIELINRYFADGQPERAKAIINDLAKIGTALGQLIRQFAELNKSNPETFVEVVDEFMKGKKRTLTPELKAKLKDLFIKQKEAFGKADKALKKWAETLSPDDQNDFDEANKAYEEASRKINSFMGNLLPKNIFDTLAPIMQLNLLTIKSILINPFSNLLFTPIRFAKNYTAAGADAIFSYISKNPRTKLAPTINKGGFKAVGKGFQNAWKKAWRGSMPDDLKKVEMHKQLNPIQAWKELFGNKTGLTPEEAKSFERTLSNIFEGTVGVPANIMGRLLPFGDDPFYEPAKYAALLEFGRLKGLKGDALKSFLINPDAESLEQATKEAKEATFQEDTSISKFFNYVTGQIEKLGPEHPLAAGALKFLLKANVPFVKTPAAYLKEVITYSVPIIPFTQAAVAFKSYQKYTKEISPSRSEEANQKSRQKAAEFQRKAVDDLGKAIVGATMVAVSMTIIGAGFVEGPDDDKEEKKRKAFRYSTKGGANTLNVSALKRWIASGGKDKSIKPDDEKVSLDRLGIFGANMSIVEESLRIKPNKKDKYNTSGELIAKESKDLQDALALFYRALPAALRNALNQGFTQGAGALAQAVSDGEWDNYITQMSKATTGLILPNTMDQLSRANRTYMLDMRANTLNERLSNVVKSKLGIFGMDKDIPIKYGLFGEKINQTPIGSNPNLYQSVNVLNKAKIFQDDIYYQLNQLDKEAGGDDDLIPSIPSQDIKVKGDIIDLTALNRNQYNEYLRLVGEERRKLVEPILAKNKPYSEDLKKDIVDAYERGLKKGARQYLRLNPIKVTKK